MCGQSFSCVQLFVTPGTVACQAPLSMRLPSKNTWVHCRFLLQGIFLTQRPNLFISCVSCTGTETLYHGDAWEAPHQMVTWVKKSYWLRKLKIELAYDPAIPLLDKTIIRKDTCTSLFKAALFIMVNTWKQPKCPSLDKWIKKMWYIYSMDYYSATKKNELMPFTARRMPLDIIMPGV